MSEHSNWNLLIPVGFLLMCFLFGYFIMLEEVSRQKYTDLLKDHMKTCPKCETAIRSPEPYKQCCETGKSIYSSFRNHCGQLD